MSINEALDPPIGHPSGWEFLAAWFRVDGWNYAECLIRSMRFRVLGSERCVATCDWRVEE